VDQDDEIRIIELPAHPFFMLTLFVPQTRSTAEAPHPIIRGFVDTVCSRQGLPSRRTCMC
jgi:CTP synthase (UTP-ammonia lyase)